MLKKTAARKGTNPKAASGLDKNRSLDPGEWEKKTKGINGLNRLLNSLNRFNKLRVLKNESNLFKNQIKRDRPIYD